MRVILSVFHIETLSKYTYFYISKTFTSYIFLLIFKTNESLQCILNVNLPNKIKTDDVRLPQDYLRHFMKVLLLPYITNPILVQRIVDFLEL